MSHSTSDDNIHRDHEKPFVQHISGTQDLSRQITLQLNADQYERLFFQPNSAKGDLSRPFLPYSILSYQSAPTVVISKDSAERHPSTDGETIIK
ncbi:putative protein alcS [Rutstroemia sp. NJR-2017a BBW]|nr:putative protein alcS [Rutstroemia sp. NJR-2017a BBW]